MIFKKLIHQVKSFVSNFSRKKVFILFLFLFFILIGFFYFQQGKMQREMELKVQFIEQKNMLRDELDDLIDEHDNLLDEYGDLNNQLEDKDSIIQSQISEIRGLIRTKNDLKKAKEKIKILKSISARYLDNIDSLFLINEELILIKDSVIKVNKNINWKNYKLNKKNEELAEKVSKGSVLEFTDLDIKTKRYRNTGSEVVTRSAKKVQKIVFCFTVGANQISTAETKRVYMQLIHEETSLIKGIDSISSTLSDSIIDVTTFADFEYNNVASDFCFEWERVEKLESGNYLVKLIIEDRIVIQNNFKLR